MELTLVYVDRHSSDESQLGCRNEAACVPGNGVRFECNHNNNSWKPKNRMSVLILDNGASTIKAGIMNSQDDNPVDSTVPHIVPNAIVRSKGDKQLYIGPQIRDCRDYFGLHYRLPFDKVAKIPYYG
jgi:hypothetical protein